MGYIGGSTGGSATFLNVTSQATTRTTIQVSYENGDSSQRFANVAVNGKTQPVAFLPTADGQTPGTSSLNCDVRSGTNTIALTTTDGSWGPDIDKLVVPIN